MFRRKNQYSSRFGATKKRRSFLFPLFILLCIAGGAAWFFFFESTPPEAALTINTQYLGNDSTIEIDVKDGQSGIKSVSLIARQGDKEIVIYNKKNNRNGYKNPVGPTEEKAKIAVNGKKLGFTEGPVELLLEVRDFSFQKWLKGNKTDVIQEVTIDTEAPKIQILHTGNYITAGGTSFAIYKVTDPEATTGVKLNGKLFKSFPVSPRHKDIYVNYFAAPYDMHHIAELTITATDKAGNTTVVPIVTSLKVPDRVKDTIQISDNFLNRKIPEFQQYYPDLTGSMLDKYVFINNTIRKENASQIEKICQNPLPEKLWDGSFIRMAGSGKAGFADFRSYNYKGRIIDHQVHLGNDIASVKRADVKAANNGKVVFAGYLGIYGNMVIIDHGQGVFSLYSHMSQINVPTGVMLQKGQVLGLTGTTGMAGGDHLHFAMLIQGVFVSPREWWDKRWVQTTIETPMEELRLVP